MRHQEIGLSRTHWRDILGSFGPCRLVGPDDPEFLAAARDLACVVATSGEVDLYVVIDGVPPAALLAPRIVLVSTCSKGEIAGDQLLLNGRYRRSVDDVLLHDRCQALGIRDVHKYERDIERRVCGESRRAGRLADESIRRHMASAWQVKLGDVVLDIAGGRGFRGYVIAGLSPAASVTSLLSEDRAAEARQRFGAWAAERLRFDRLSHLGSHLAEGFFDCIVCRHRQVRPELLDAVAPGGRLVVLGRMSGEISGFRRDADPWAGMSVWMRCPLAAADIPVVDRYFLSGRADTPKALDPAWMHENPGVAVAMVTGPSRLRSPESLTDLAYDVVDTTSAGSKDGISALVVLGHRLIDGTAMMHESEWLERAAEHRARAGDDIPFLRWMVSLDFVEARIHETQGRVDEACRLYRRVAEVDAVAFHPSLLTKTAEASIRAARLELASGQVEAARQLLRTAVATTRSVLSSDPNEILGGEGALTDFYMMEAAATLQMSAYAAMALNLDARSGEAAMRRFLAKPPEPRTIFGGEPAQPDKHGGLRRGLRARVRSRLQRITTALIGYHPPDFLTGFVLLPFD